MRISRYNAYLNNTQIAPQFGSVISRVRCHLTYYTVTSVRKRGGAMETILLQIIYLLFFGLVGVSIIAIALIIALVVILSK